MKKIDLIKNSKLGHRKRLRDRFLKSGFEGFLDYEIIELLLTLGTPRKDCKDLAKTTLKVFGNLRNVLEASLEELQKIKGIGKYNAFGIKIYDELSKRLAKEHLPDKINLNSLPQVAKFLQEYIGKEMKEHFVALLLDSRYGLIKIVPISIGSLDSSIVHPRELFKEAIKTSSAKIILGHNHPSGNPEPSPEDIALTRRLQEGARIISIEILDHIIVTRNSYKSLLELNLI